MGQREKLNCNAISVKVTANPVEGSEDGTVLHYTLS